MPTNTGDAILSTLSALDRAGASIANTVDQYQRIQAASIVVNKQADYNRAKNSIAASIQGDTSLSPDQWLDEWNQRSQDFRNIYADEKNPIARQALQQMVDSGDEQVRAQFENTKAQWYKSQARVNCANGIQAGIDSGDYQQINANLATYQSLADSPEQFEQVKTSAANSYLMTTALAQLTDEMRANGKEAADVMYDHSDFAVTMFDGTRHELTPALKGQLKGQLDSAWADFAKQNDDGLGHNAANMLVSVNTEQAAHQYLGAVAKMKFVDGDEKWKWYSRGQEMLNAMKAKAAGGDPALESETLGQLALASVTAPNKGVFVDDVYNANARGALPGDKVETVLNYWKRDDSILNSELQRINSWKIKDKSGKQAMSDASVAAIAGMVAQYRATPGNESLTADKLKEFTDTITNKELAKSLFQPKRFKETFDPKNVDAQEAAISMFQGGYLGWMQENGAFDAWREAVGLPKTATPQALKTAVEQRATELMKDDYRAYMGKAADHAQLASYVDTGNGLPTVVVTRPGTEYSRSGDKPAVKTEKYVLKIMTNADYIGNSNQFAKQRYMPAVGEETWFKVETDPKGNATYQYWAPAGHVSR